jgi:aryl-alcohol dehydrogenase-like predicted oxidoreductase
MRLALGGAQLGLRYGISNQFGQVSLEVAGDIIGVARLSGIDTIDTAIAYGRSEVNLGKTGVDDFRIVTKLPPMPEQINDVSVWMQDQLRRSLDRLGVKRVHGLLLHRADQLLETRGKALFTALQQARDDGYVTKIGVSIYDPEQLASILSVCSLDIVQAPLNLLDRRLEISGWLRRLQEVGVEVHTRSTFLQGLLLMDQKTMPPEFKRWQYLWDAWHLWLKDHAVSATRACLAYPLSLSEIDRVVVGVSSAAELRMLVDDASLAAMAIELPGIACNDPKLINPSRWKQP